MTSRFMNYAPIFPRPWLQTAAEWFCYTARRYDFSS
jgi:hypothetical protein